MEKEKRRKRKKSKLFDKQSELDQENLDMFLDDGLYLNLILCSGHVEHLPALYLRASALACSTYSGPTRILRRAADLRVLSLCVMVYIKPTGNR